MSIKPPVNGPQVTAFFDPATFTATFVVADPASRRAAVIDPVLDYTARNGRTSTKSADAILAFVEQEGLTIDWLLETHAHADHLSAGHYLHEKTGAPIVIGALITQVQEKFAPLFEADDITPDGSQFDRLVNDGDELPLGDLAIRVMHTPGHTAACVSYMVGDAIFVGDTLFMPDYGTARTDFPGGNAEALYASIRRILSLPGGTRLFVGHDYLPEGRSHFIWESTVAQQNASNVHIHAEVNEADFVALRRERDAKLEAPLLILPSLQVNIRAGAMPPPTPAGHVYFRIPVNAI